MENPGPDADPARLWSVTGHLGCTRSPGSVEFCSSNEQTELAGSQSATASWHTCSPGPVVWGLLTESVLQAAGWLVPQRLASEVPIPQCPTPHDLGWPGTQSPSCFTSDPDAASLSSLCRTCPCPLTDCPLPAESQVGGPALGSVSAPGLGLRPWSFHPAHVLGGP